MICLAGALTVALYKGPAVISHHDAHPLVVQNHKAKYLRGSMFLVGSVLCYGLWFIFQACLTRFLHLMLVKNRGSSDT